VSTTKANLGLAGVVLAIYLAGQLLIGTISPEDGSYRLTNPMHMDFVYYISMANQIVADFPPQNPSYGGVAQTQPWIHFIPVTILSEFINPYLTLKVLNVFYAICFLLIMRKYVPDTWGMLSFLFLCTSTIFYSYGHSATPLMKHLADSSRFNPASIDLLARAFTHMPFFILFVVALFEKRRLWLAVLCSAALGWIDGLMALAVFFGFLFHVMWKRDFRTAVLTAAMFIGIVTFALNFGHKGTHIIDFFVKNIRFDPWKPIVHVYLFAPLFIWARDSEKWSLFASSFLLCCFVQVHSYHFIFVLNLATAFLVIDSLKRAPERVGTFFRVAVCVGFSMFLLYALAKYNPTHPVDPYAPIQKELHNASLNWIQKNTHRKAIFLILPPAIITDVPLVQQERTVYLGYKAFAEFLGIATKEREKNAYMAYKKGHIPKNVDYIYYGPRESHAFPEFSTSLPVVYKDDHVIIYDAKPGKDI
jgi:hypothetical protein